MGTSGDYRGWRRVSDEAVVVEALAPAFTTQNSSDNSNIDAVSTLPKQQRSNTMFGLLRSHRLIFEGRSEVGGDVWSLAFRPEPPFRARAGQHGLLRIPGASIKAFSLASAPEEATVLIGTSLASESSFKTRLAALQPDDPATLRGPLMNFTLAGAADHVVLLAQGVGITPLRSILGHIALAGLRTQTSLVHVAAAGHAFRADTERWADSADYPQHAEQFRTSAVAAAQGHPNATFYIAGASSFVTSTAALLRQVGIAKKSIRQDKYLGHQDRRPTTSDQRPATSDQRPRRSPGYLPRDDRTISLQFTR
jgi:ferredoxin-NADP reductase